MADVKSFFPFFIVYTLTDVIIKVTVGTLFHRERTIISKPGQLQKEEKHLYQSLKDANIQTGP